MDFYSPIGRKPFKKLNLDKPPLKALSFGAGVQSTAILHLIIEGKLDRPDLVVFSDTGWEPSAVYAHLEEIRKLLEQHSIPFYAVRLHEEGILSSFLPNKGSGGTPPLTGWRPKENGKLEKFMLTRQCTLNYKIVPIKRLYRDLRDPDQQVEQWLGISTDEVRRVKDSRVAYIKNKYPLIELGLSRADCLSYLASIGASKPPKSACVGCPYRSDASWSLLKTQNPDEFEFACRVDDSLRADTSPWKTRSKMLYKELYLHSSGRPLRELDFTFTPVDEDQSMFVPGFDCDGLCGN